MIGKQGEDDIKIPVPSIELPKFKFGSKERWAELAKVKVNPGDEVDQDGDAQPGQGEAGDKAGSACLRSRCKS